MSRSMSESRMPKSALNSPWLMSAESHVRPMLLPRRRVLYRRPSTLAERAGREVPEPWNERWRPVRETQGLGRRGATPILRESMSPSQVYCRREVS